MTHKPRLIPLNPGDPGEVRLSADGTSIGRAPANTICLEADESLSRVHARIHHHLGLFWLEDLGSTNGTFLTLPGMDESRLGPDEVRILLDDSEVRTGLNARFKAAGLLPGEGSGDRSTLAGIHAHILAEYARLAELSGSEREQLSADLKAYQHRLVRADDLAAAGRQGEKGDTGLSKTVFGSLDSEDLGVFGRELPPMEKDLPDPDAPRPFTVKGTLLPDMMEPDDEDDHE